MSKRTLTVIFALIFAAVAVILAYLVAAAAGAPPTLWIGMAAAVGIMIALGLLALAIVSYRPSPKPIAPIPPTRAAAAATITVREEPWKWPAIVGSAGSDAPTTIDGTFVGREQELQLLLDALRSSDATSMLLIAGMDGIGKTALAAQAAAAAQREQRFVATIWYSARQKLDAAQHSKDIGGLSTYNDLLNYTYYRLINAPYSSKQVRDERLRRRLRTEPHLLVIDNLELVQDRKLLLHDLPSFLRPSRALFAGRRRWNMVDDLGTIVLPGLSEAEASLLVRREARRRGAHFLANAGPETLRDVCQVARGMPLALQLLTAASTDGEQMERLLRRLEIAANEEELYRFLYLDLWQTMSEPAQLALVAMTAFVAPVDVGILAAASGLEVDVSNAATAELERKGILYVHGHGAENRLRYSLHGRTCRFVAGELHRYERVSPAVTAASRTVYQRALNALTRRIHESDPKNLSMDDRWNHGALLDWRSSSHDETTIPFQQAHPAEAQASSRQSTANVGATAGETQPGQTGVAHGRAADPASAHAAQASSAYHQPARFPARMQRDAGQPKQQATSTAEADPYIRELLAQLGGRPADSDIRWRLAQRYVDLHAEQQAIAHYAILLRDRPELYDARIELVDCYIKLAMWDPASSELRYLEGTSRYSDEVKRRKDIIRERRNADANKPQWRVGPDSSEVRQ